MSSKGILDDSPALDKNGGNIPAFPVYPRIEAGKSSQINGAVGMTLRDYFAAKAMQGMMADHGLDRSPAELSEWAYKIADAMLAERVK